MARHAAQLADGAPVCETRAAVLPAAAAGVADPIAQRVAEHPVVFIDELATLLEDASVRTIRRQLRAGTFFIPTLPKVDRKHRWSRARVYAAIAETTVESHRQTVRGLRAVPPRIHRGEQNRERGGR
jgi:hypothetical protein